MNLKTKISALLITYNEINHIQEVIENVSFADEIIVVDSNSKDGTLEILAKNNEVKVITRDFKNFADQRNFAISQATKDWILFIDADERIPQTLQTEILDTVNSDTNISGFMFKRQYFFNSKPINYSGFQTDTTYRLFKNGKVKYDKQKIVHEMPIIDGASDILKHKMLHYSFTTPENFKAKMEHYGRLKALELFKKGKTAKLFHFIIKPAYKFVFNYIIRLGFLDGREGYKICKLNAYGVYYRYKELKRLNLASK